MIIALKCGMSSGNSTEMCGAITATEMNSCKQTPLMGTYDCGATKLVPFPDGLEMRLLLSIQMSH